MSAIRSLHTNEALRCLPDSIKEEVFSAFVEQSYAFGDEILREGEAVPGLFVVLSGKARVLKRGQDGSEVPLGLLGPGDSFGEMSLLAHEAAGATIRASGDLVVAILAGEKVQELIATEDEFKNFLERQTRLRTLANFFKSFSQFKKLPQSAQHFLLEELEELSVPAGALVIREGDAPGPMYFVKEGQLRVVQKEGETTSNRNFLRKGDHFGEMSLFQNIARSASVIAEASSDLLCLNPETYKKLLESSAEFKRTIEERIAQYEYQKVASVPLDFQQENLPAAVQREVEAEVDSAERDEEHNPFAEDGHFVKGEEISKFPFLYQLDEMDCGAACLAMICRHFGRKVSITRIRELLHVGLDGTSLQALCSGAERLGLAARTVKTSIKNLVHLPLPAIVHWDSNHWIVLYQVGENYVRVADPALGLRKISGQEFVERWSGYTALFDYTERFEQAPLEKNSIGWILPFLKPYRGVMARAAGLGLVLSALQMILPIFTQVVVDRVVVDQNGALLTVLMLSMIVVITFSIAATLLQRYLLNFVSVRVDAGSLDLITRKLFSLPMSYFSSRRTGDIQRRLEGTKQIREFLMTATLTGLTSALQLLVAIVVMFAYSPLLSAVFLLITPFYLALMKLSGRFLKPLFDRVEEEYGRYGSQQIDAIKGIETVKAMGAEGKLREMMLGQFHRIAGCLFPANMTVLAYEGLVNALSLFSTVVFLWVGAYQVMQGSLTIGALMAFNGLVALANAPLQSLLGLWDNYQIVTVLVRRLQDIFDTEPEQGEDHSALLPVRSMQGQVDIENLSFRYGDEQEPKIVDSVTLHVKAGTKVAIVGRSGSGKTTLVKLLSGLLTPTEGTLRFDTVDFKTIDHRDLRRHIGMVLQDNYLFNATIGENIAFGEHEIDPDRLTWAAQMACADEFIKRLPLGYETKVGESGLLLSGGQRQRIAIARALYHNPAILIFDEATSALDTESERALKGNLAKVMQGRTSFVIAHRLTTIREADLILVMERGAIVEQGTHAQLMERRGLYFYLCSEQVEGT